METVNKTDDLEGLFVEAKSLLCGALDLLLHYAETAESPNDGGCMNRVHFILSESTLKFKEYEEKAF